MMAYFGRSARPEIRDAKTIELVLSSKIYGGEAFQVTYDKGTDGELPQRTGNWKCPRRFNHQQSASS